MPEDSVVGEALDFPAEYIVYLAIKDNPAFRLDRSDSAVS